MPLRLLLAATLLLLALPLAATNYPPATVEMTLRQISDHVYVAQGKAGVATDHQGFISNAGVILTERGVVVVDALGTPSLAQLLLQRIAGITDRPVTTVIVTHYHADHIYGLQVFKEHGATIVAPAGYADYLDAPIGQQRLAERRQSLAPWVDEDTRLVRPDRVIDQDEVMELGDVTLQLRYLGTAHSDGDLSVLVEPDRVLISGDLIFEGRVPFTGSADTRRWLALVEELDKNHLAAIVPGHGAVIEEPRSTVTLTLRYLRFLRERMAAAVEEMIPFDEAYDAIDWSDYADLPAFEAVNRRNAYGVYLSLEQETMEQ